MLLQFHKITEFSETHQFFLKLFVYFEVVLLISSCIILPYIHWYLLNYSKFHRNLILIIAFNSASYFLDMCSRLLISAFEIGVFRMEEDIDPNSDEFLTTSQILQSPILCLFFVCSLMRITEMIIISTFGLIIFFERFCATIWAKNYEHRKKTWISAVLIFWCSIVSVTFSVVYHYELFNIKLLVLLAVFLNIASILALNSLYFINRRRLKIVQKKMLTSRYTLSYRFQLNENISIIRFTRYFISFCVISDMILAILFGLTNIRSFRKSDPLLVTYLHQIFNLSIAIYGLFSQLLVLFSEKNIRQHFLTNKSVKNLTIGCFGRCFPDDFGINQTSKMTCKEETKVYFDGLTSQWDHKLGN
ncbi:unnamed protein product [Caenorhabditis angaria]|uniref:Uncharacterized protein n=1 Tax=Caenorhabditis angaria TaxID=860376 RepID=A0A9P1IE49_9PELO|nr:unnamed protein product [Caenorhabditis angaria]